MITRLLRRAARLALLSMAAATSAVAQVPVGADSLSPAAVAESLAVLKTLDDAVRTNKNDGTAWHRQGMVAWVLSIRADAKPEVRGLDGNKLTRLAETSLRTAAQIEEKNVRYLMAAGGFLRNSNDALSRQAAIGFFDKALEVGRATPDPAIRAAVAIEAGRVRWLRYDTEAHRRQYLGTPPMAPPDDCGARIASGMSPSLDSATVIGNKDPNSNVPLTVLSASEATKRLHNELLNCTKSMPNAGQSDYLQAESLFREAVTAAPDDPRAFRQLAMLLVEKKRWRELEAEARSRTTRVPADPNAWLALGLALHRLGSERGAAVFDTAIARLSAPERGRLFAFSRLLGRKDSASYAKATAEARQRSEQSFWAMADPLWSRPGDEPRTEFIARVAYAELRWTVEELGVRGADSDRGAIFVRYGPPDSIAVIRGNDYTGGGDQSGSAFAGHRAPNPNAARMPQPSNVVTFWDYDTGLLVVFWGQPAFGTARYPVDDAMHVAELIENRPVAFDNIAAGRIDDIALRALRFRAGGDSTDLLFLTQANVSAIQSGAAANAPVWEYVWLFGRDVPNAYRDSLPLEGDGLKAWAYRVPRSVYMYRVEASAAGSSVSARATTWVTAATDSATGFATNGFGMSDLLLATEVAPRRATPARWRDFDFDPVMRSIPKRSRLDVIWENYELGQREGRAQYLVALTIQRQRSAAGQIAAQIIGAAGSVVGVNRANNDRLTLQFERSGPASATVVDHFGVDLADTPSGTYRLTLEITDRATGRKTSRTTEIMIRE